MNTRICPTERGADPRSHLGTYSGRGNFPKKAHVHEVNQLSCENRHGVFPDTGFRSACRANGTKATHTCAKETMRADRGRNRVWAQPTGAPVARTEQKQRARAPKIRCAQTRSEPGVGTAHSPQSDTGFRSAYCANGTKATRTCGKEAIRTDKVGSGCGHRPPPAVGYRVPERPLRERNKSSAHVRQRYDAHRQGRNRVWALPTICRRRSARRPER